LLLGAFGSKLIRKKGTIFEMVDQITGEKRMRLDYRSLIKIKRA